MERMAMASSITTGRFWMLPMPRMAAFGWVLAGRAPRPAEDARVGDAEGRVLDLFGLELLRASALGQVVQRPLQAEEVHLVGALDDRDDEPPVERHGDADVDVLVQHDVGAVPRS